MSRRNVVFPAGRQALYERNRYSPAIRSNGFLFVSHRGEIFPSGFLPLRAGNVRHHRVEWVYRYSPVFRQLRAPAQLKGVCGECEFNALCGGSRSRSFALTGDYLASDPWCVYRPSRKDATISP